MNLYSLFFVCLGVGVAVVSLPAIAYELWMVVHHGVGDGPEDW